MKFFVLFALLTVLVAGTFAASLRKLVDSDDLAKSRLTRSVQPPTGALNDRVTDDIPPVDYARVTDDLPPVRQRYYTGDLSAYLRKAKE